MGWPKKCQEDYTILPLISSENDWPALIRLILYLLGLGYLFLGVAVISDIFMAGIEKVTSSKKRVWNKEKDRWVTVEVWNATVANLTLMALGSSAPEILLSMIELCLGNMLLGDLGAGTIVGSAAFNLLIISAVCVCAIPDGEVRYIKEVPVYAITSSFSVFAYIWLLFILQISSPDVCEVWEAILTLFFMPLLVVLAYLADRGYFSKEATEHNSVSDNPTEEELAAIERDIQVKHGPGLTKEQVEEIFQRDYCKHTRAYYRRLAMKGVLHNAHHHDHHAEAAAGTDKPATGTDEVVEADKKNMMVTLAFRSSKYSCVENCGEMLLSVERHGPLDATASVRYKTVEGTAKAGEDFTEAAGTVVFKPDQKHSFITIPIKDDTKFEGDEEFYVELLEPTTDAASHKAVLSPLLSRATITIIDNDMPGMISFEKEEVQVDEEDKDFPLNVRVHRDKGCSKATFNYSCESMGAVAGFDYEDVSGEAEFPEGAQDISIPITIKPSSRVGKASFNLVLKDATGATFHPETDGGEEACICHITINHRCTANRSTMDVMKARVVSANAVVGTKNWKQQFVDAVFKVVEDEEEEESGGEPPVPTPFDWFMHIVGMPWKLLFALVPPTDFLGGWACFFGALVFIGGITAIVGDMANLVGCVLGIDPEITAITFVALGTSLPDTFASKAAAVMDEHADASIGNVVGSNSVNVFLGIGLSWALGACVWVAQDISGMDFGMEESPKTIWWNKFFMYNCDQQKNIADAAGFDLVNGLPSGPSIDKAIFMTPAGSMWFNLMVFSLNALCAIQHLLARRKKYGGELGGPKKAQYLSGAFLTFQWFIYVAASAIYCIANEKVEGCEIPAMTLPPAQGGITITNTKDLAPFFPTP